MDEKSVLKIVDHAFAGCSAKQIARRLGLKTKRVKRVLRSAREKLMLRDRKQADAEDRNPFDLLTTGNSSAPVQQPLIGGSQVMVLPMTHNEFVVQNAVAELTERVGCMIQFLDITLIGIGNILPDTALSIWHLLNNRPKGVQLSVTAQSSLINADLLVYLAGDRRRLRPDAWICFERPQHTDSGWNAKPGSSGKRASGYETDYAAAFRIITRYLPEEFAGRRIHAAELDEWLIEEETSETHQTIVAAEASPAYNPSVARG